MKTILLADTAGFCMGVALALRKLDQAIAERKDQETIFTQGPIIHNPQVLERYRAKNVFECNELTTLNADTTVVIRAHGIPLALHNALKATGTAIVDATCPKVKKAQLLIAQNAQQGRYLLLFGEKEHPEVQGLVSYASAGFTVFEDMEELAAHIADLPGPFFMAAQTTQDREEFETFKAHLLERFPDMPIMDTICTATKERQLEAMKIAQKVDYMVVVGGKNSGNTRRLAQVAGSQGTPCRHVERVNELPFPLLADCTTVGITAGASTPEDVITEVYQALQHV